jgi:hypothetical protein
MKEKLSIHEDSLDSAAKLFQIADKCAKAEEGRMFNRPGEMSSTTP